MTTLLLAALLTVAQDKEEDYYPIVALPIPPGVVLEGGGLELMPDGRLAASSRRGDIYMVENPFGRPEEMKFTLWAQGLHEVLGLSYYDGWLYATQRCEVTKIKDADGDGRADTFRTVCDDWSITGDYHEYAFGSKFDREGNMWVVLCLTGSFNSNAPYRGWCVRVSHDGKMIPTCSGIRSPGGIGIGVDGEVFYCDNQGPWNGTSSLKHLKPGSFQSHPASFKWYDLPLVKKHMGPKPAEPKSGSRFHVEAARIPEYVPPPVLIPHGKLGNSASGVAHDTTGGKFGPFQGQMFAGDQSHSVVNRIFLEKYGDGRYQGVVFPFRQGFGSGNVPMLMTSRGAMFVGGTNRGWGSRGSKPFALERMTWSGKVPFEIHEMRIKPDGFELTFTRPVDRAAAAKVSSYSMKTFTYIMQASYGSPEVDPTTPTITGVTVGDDGMSVRLRVEGLQIGHLHDLKLPGITSSEGRPLLHPQAYYTLWELPK